MDKKITIIRQTIFESVVSDLFLLGGAVFVVWFNENYIGGSEALNFFMLICFITLLIGQKSKAFCRFSNNEDAIKFLKGEK